MTSHCLVLFSQRKECLNNATLVNETLYVENKNVLAMFVLVTFTKYLFCKSMNCLDLLSPTPTLSKGNI